MAPARRAPLPLALALFTACTRSPSGSAQPQPSAAPSAPSVATEDPALSAQAAGHLAGLFQRTGTATTVAEALVRLPEHTLRVRVIPGEVSSQRDVTAASVTVSMALDDAWVPGFRAVSVALDASRREAQEHALREWLVSAGIPLVDALRAHGYAPVSGDAGAGASTATTGLTLGPFTVFAGPTGARGTPPDGWRSGTTVMHRGLLERIEPALDEVLPRARRERFHSLAITLHIHNGAAQQGECRVDGVSTPRLCAAARTYAWPEGASDFIFRQHYVLAAPSADDAGPVGAPSAMASR